MDKHEMVRRIAEDRKAMEEIGIEVNLRKQDDGEYLWEIVTPMGGALLLGVLLAIAGHVCAAAGRTGRGLPPEMDMILDGAFNASGEPNPLMGLPEEMRRKVIAEVGEEIARAVSTAISMKGMSIARDRE